MNLEPDDPIRGLARAYAAPFINIELGTRAQVINDLACRFEVDGMVMHANRSCKPFSLTQLDLKDALRDECQFSPDIGPLGQVTLEELQAKNKCDDRMGLRFDRHLLFGADDALCSEARAGDYDHGRIVVETIQASGGQQAPTRASQLIHSKRP